MRIFLQRVRTGKNWLAIIALILSNTITGLSVNGQTQVAAWTFDATAAAPNTPKVVTANLGSQASTASIYADGSNGSSNWLSTASNPELTAFGGTTLNDPRTTTSAGNAYSLANSSANGKNLIIKFSMSSLQDPSVSFATRGTSTGFNTHQWAWSIDGTTFTNFGTNTAVTATAFSTKTLDLSSINEIDNAATVYLRLTVSGATNASGNNRIDNIVINASTIASSPVLGISGTTEHGSICPGVAAPSIQYTITNTGSVQADGIQVVSSDPQFVVSGLSSTSIAASGGTATYTVTFTPSSLGSKSSTIAVSSTTSGSNAPTSSLTGTGTAPISQAISTSAISALSNTKATLNGNLTVLGVCPATTEKGFFYALTSNNSNPENNGTGVTKVIVASLATGAYTTNLSDLVANSGYSYKAYALNADGIYTYGSVQSFTTLQAASSLAFGTAPAATGNVNTNLTAFTVEARRADNSLDAEFTGNVTIARNIVSGSANLTGTLSVAAIAGVATFSAAQFDAVGTYTITAASGTLTSITSSNIVITVAPVLWNFGTTSGSSAVTSGASANVTISNISQGNNNGTTSLLDNGSTSSGYTNASGNYNAGAAARTGAINTGASGSAYFEFTLTPAIGYTVTVADFNFGTRSTSTGPQAYSLRSSLDNYATDIVTGTINNNSAWNLKLNPTVNAKSNPSSSITFRLFGYSGTGSPSANTANWRIDDITMNLVIAPVSPVNADYRSKTDGDFSSASNWEYNVGGSNWANTTVAPASTNNITITHNIALDQNFTVTKNLTLSTGGALTINAARTLDVQAGGSVAFGGNAVTIKSGPAGSGAIGKILGTLSGATNVTVERYIPANASRAWRLLAVPTTGAQTIFEAWQENGAPFTSNGLGTQITKPGANQATNGYDAASAAASLLNAYNVTTNTWSNTITSTRSTAIASDGGYFIFVRGDRSKGIAGTNADVNATTLRTKGGLKQGNITSSNIAAGQYGILGNPYPSAIGFDLLTKGAGIDNTYYIWDAKKIQGTSLGFYQTFTATNGYVPTPGGGSYSGANTTIESGQAFFVHATTSGTVTFTENAKVASSTNLGMRPVEPATPTDQLVKLTAKLFGGSSEILDGNDVVFDAKYKNELDGNDALKFRNPAENFAIARGSSLLAVEGRQPVADKDEIQFNTSNLKQQVYKLQLTPQNLDKDGLTAILKDNYKGTSTTLNLSAATTLEFTVDANAASAAVDRFKVVFTLVKQPVESSTGKPGITIAPNPVRGSQLSVQIVDKPTGKYNIRLVNNVGQAVVNKTIQHAGGTATHTVTLPSGVTDGTYQVEIIAPDKTRKMKKLAVIR